MLGKQYASSVLTLAQQVAENQLENINAAADMVYESLKNDGLLHVFGCGHSHMLCEECFYRAGGLVPVNPIFETSTMLHDGAVKSSQIERMSGYAPVILDNYTLRPGEVMLVFSTSGINSMPIEIAQGAKERGLKVIAFSSENYDASMSRDKSGKRMPDFADLVIDTGVPKGDTMVTTSRFGIAAVPGSTVVGAMLLNMLIAEILERYEQDGEQPPVFISGNTKGGFEKNEANIQAYKGRVRAL